MRTSRLTKWVGAGLLAVLASAGVSRQADAALILDLSNPFPTIAPTGSTQTYVISGTIYNAGTQSVDVSTISFNTPIYDDAGDSIMVNADFTPVVLAPLSSASEPLISLTISPNQPYGLYNRDSSTSTVLPVVTVAGVTSGNIPETAPANFAADIAVPEPACLGLLGVGLLALRRRRTA